MAGTERSSNLDHPPRPLLGGHHGPDAFWVKGMPKLVQVTLLGQHLANLLVAETGTAQASGFLDGFGLFLGVNFRPSTFTRLTRLRSRAALSFLTSRVRSS